MFTGIVEEVGRVRFPARRLQRTACRRHCRQAGFGRCATGRRYRSRWCVSDGDGLRRRLFDGGCPCPNPAAIEPRECSAPGGAPSIWSALWWPTGASGAISYRVISTVWARLPRCVRRRTPCGTEIEAAPSLLRLVVEKGSVALDGISLTVASVSDASSRYRSFRTRGSRQTLASKGVGDKVNMENDVIGKYVERLLPRASPGKDELWGKGGGSPKASPSSPGLTRDFLAAHGF